MMDIYGRLNDREFTNKLKYPEYPRGTLKTPEALVSYKLAREAYDNETSRLTEEFQKALAEEHGMKMNKTFYVLFSKAWSDGHASGFYEIAGHFSELVSFIKSYEEAAKNDRLELYGMK